MKNRTLTFGAKLAISVGALAAALILTAGAGLRSIATLDGAFEMTTGKTARKIELAGSIAKAEADMAVGQRGLILFSYSKNPERAAASRELFEQSRATLQKALTELRTLFVTERGRQLTAQIESGVATWLSGYAELDRLAGAGDLDGATRVLSEKIMPQYQGVGEFSKELVELEDQVLQNDRAAAQEQYATSKWLMFLMFGVGSAAAAISMTLVRSATRAIRHLAGEMLEGSRQVAGASAQVASASQSLAQGTSEQAATLEETSSSSTEITSITRKNTENTRTVAGLMIEVSHLVDGANHNLEEMVQSMTEINSSSDRISKIIRVIDEIAFQTNILALNAAVEAARAGEAGMGFAVVADEVRNLAHRSAQAARDTAALIEESIGKSKEGSRKLDQVAGSIQQITASASQVKTLVDEIEVGSQEQSRGIEQIAGAVGQMEQVTQRSAANAEESAAAGEELAAQAQSLHSIVERLRAVVGSEQSVAPSSKAGLRGKTAVRQAAAGTRDLVRLGKSLQPSRQETGSPATVLARGHDSFPLDDSEQGL